tara:strand:+ start:1429 stop:1662 length:234 start_codon:yes stop_codon:yes gene_type:complete
MIDSSLLGKDKAITSKTIGIIRGLKGKTAVKLEFRPTVVMFYLQQGEDFGIPNELFNKLDTNEIVNIIEGHINGRVN